MVLLPLRRPAERQSERNWGENEEGNPCRVLESILPPVLDHWPSEALHLVSSTRANWYSLSARPEIEEAV
jgi:hypothetical protein